MANIGPTSAFYNVETSVTRSQIEINKSLERIATGKQIANLGDGAAVANMVDEFRLDFVGTKAGIKSAAVVMGYLETGMRVLNSAGTLLSRLQELAVLGASDLNTTQDHEAVNTEAEAIAQEFNRLMSNNSYKGKNIFVDTTGSEHLSMGSQNSAMTFGIGKIDYSNLFGTARSVEEGLPNAGQVVNLTSLPSDAVLSALIELETKIAEQYLEVAVSSNLAQEDNLSLNNTANVTIDENNVISYNFNHADHGNVSIEIGEIDPTSDGSQGVLKINFYDDATIPDSGNLVNGDFESGTSSAFGVPTEVYSNAGFEHRVGMVNTFAVQNAGNGYVEFNDTLSTLLTRGSNTYSISFDSNGAGTGFRANVLVADDGSLSIAEVLDKGQGYSIGEILTVAQDARGIALAGSDFSISITSTLSSNDTDPGRNADNIHEVTQPNFQSVTYTVENGPDGRYDWGESYIEGTAQKIATNDGTGNITNYIHAVAGNYASDIVMIDGVAQPLFTDVYENDDVAAGVLIVENFIPTFAQDDAILEQVSVADYVANTGGNNNGTETAFYAINPVDGQRVTTNWTYDEYTTGVSDGSIISTGATVTQQISGVTNILADDYDGGGPQFIDTPNFGIGVIAVGDELPTDNVVYNLENSSGIYDWGGGSYTNGSIVKDPTGSDFTINIRHAVDGVYTFDVSGTDFDPADLNYSAGDEALEFVTWADQFDPDNPPVGSTVYRTDIRHDADGAYTFDVSGSDFNPADLNYYAGDDRLEFFAWADQFDPDNPPAGSTVYRTNNRHDADGAYTFDVSGTNFNPVGLNYNAGDVRLEFVAWADQFDPDNPPAGSIVYRTDDELATPAFFTRAEEATPAFFTRAEEATPEFFTRTEEATPLFFTRAEEATPEFFTRIDDALAAPEFFTRSAGTVSYSNSVSHYERPVITDYDRQEITGYSREEIAFYTRNKQLRTAINTSGQVEKYLGESRITNNPDGSLIRAHVGWERDNQVYINNWTTYDDRVEFGSNFEIYDTDGTYAWNGDGSGFDPEEVPEISIPTPTLDQMAKPNYGTFTRLDGSPGNPAVRNRDDAVNVPVLQSGGEDVRDYSDTFSLDTPDVPVGLVSDDTITHPFSGTAMELFTGKLKFEDSAAFGIYHGPAIVSDQFRAEEGQVLRLNYNAAGDVDDYHVAGYIYEVDPNTGNPVLDANGDAKIMMALNETGTVELDGRASVDIEADGDYRFVFIVGTFDKTGGLAAGASMRIDNIVAEFKYSVDEEAVAALLQAVNYSNDDIVSNETSAITSTLTNSNGSLSKGEIVAHLEGSDDSDEADGPITVAATLLSALNENENEGEGIITSTTEEVKTGLLTSKIDRVQRMLNKAREQAGSQYSALESLVISTTDLTAEYESKYKELYNVNLSDETALLAKRQMLAQSANAFLAQAGEGQQHLLKLLKDTQKSNTPTY